VSRFENACFISYAHCRNETAREVVEAFKSALEGQVQLYMPHHRVYRDTERLGGGDFFNRELAEQLCRSVCMVLLFNPGYFDCNHPYCAREYKAMVTLEAERLGLSQEEFRTRGLIIPVVIRGDDDLPEEIRSFRNYTSFSKQVLVGQDFYERDCIEKIEGLAGDIYRRWKMLRGEETALTSRCNEFEFPSEEDVREWLEGIVGRRPRPSMPGR